mmetsp:Transcript_2850/g.5782  ORF Transcript_2850/g.5782 Transcript_2850/m.5782 type:complete len:589 (+) Transcript_2850:112-1878(+)|eukprot:CAMPEP_0182571878 /NCGR_PEP_ID=MMETSP1324-20130603/15351_1 /TAXON_ID=236786 /ORGANISM="Florenciella sp., Strain RCC1587" /LENGTH=588 /DNA_ID=CAMNT_0024786633 /DNA_START=111 /DNA_END=1877 /DNA_ORIENTATION=+
MSGLSLNESKNPKDAPPDHQWTLPDRATTKISEANTAGVSESGFVAPLFSPWEAEQRIENLREFDVADVGSKQWMAQHEALEQLNLQAHQSAQGNQDEFVIEALVTLDKVRLLVHELLATEAWRLHLFPRLKGALAELKATMRGYFCLYHEATLVNLLSICLHHAHVTEALGESAVELVDYLARRMVELNSKGKEWSARGVDAPTDTKEMAAKIDAMTPLSELEDQSVEVNFQACVGCATVVRYLIEHVNTLPLSVLTRMVDTHDILLTLIPIIENPPWTRRTPEGKWQKLIDDKWKTVEPAELLTLTKTEGQMWLALFHFICNAEIQKRYHFNSFRKGQLLRARKYINEVLLDQLPVLADVQRFMDELALMEAPEPSGARESGALMMEQVATTTEKLVRQRDWDELAKEQLEKIFSAQSDLNDMDLRRLVDNVYTLDGVEDVLGEAPPSDLYAQELGGMVAVLMGEEGDELGRFEYKPTGKPKAIATAAGPFLRRKFVAPAAARELVLPENVMLKVELSFVGSLAFDTALVSDTLTFVEKGSAPLKEWCQLGALKDKLAVQVQLVQSTEGGGFRIGDAYSSTPEPAL